MESFEIPDSTVNGAILLKQTYLRYLDTYEKIHYLGEDGDDADDDDWYKDAEDSRSRRQKSQKVQNSIPLSYNLNQHNVSGKKFRAFMVSFSLVLILLMRNYEYKLKSNLSHLQRKYVLHLGCQQTCIRKQIMTAWLFRLLHLCQMNKILV